MTRINTNVGSLVAQTNLSRTNNDLQTSLTRLSTGLRINTGKDDPAGLIASEALRSDITSINKALSNTQRANQIIATADSALGQVSSLLNDIRGLVTEAANNGALSDDEISANQLQVDSSIEAINRISQNTTFQGRRLLDGSLGFQTDAQAITNLTDLQIEKANLGTSGNVNVDVQISAAATQASLSTKSGAVTAAASATATLKFAPEAVLTGFNDANANIVVRAKSTDSKYAGVTVSFIADSTAVGAETAVYDDTANTLKIHINNAAASTSGNVIAAINKLANFEAFNGTGGGNADVVDGSLAGDAAINDSTATDQINITAATSGADYNNVKVKVATSSSVAAGSPTASYDSTKKELTVTVNDTGTTTIANIATAVNNLAEFNATSTANGNGSVSGTSADVQATANTNNTGGGVLLDDLSFEIQGQDGAEVFSFKAGASVNQIADAVSLVSDATGVKGFQSGQTVTFKSTKYGSDSKVAVNVISEGAAGKFKANLSAFKATGTDIAASINGITANAKGNVLSINTSALSLSLTVSDGSSTNFNFNITGGGALFQLGPDVVSNQQARLGIDSINAAKLGGASGKLFELASGGNKALKTNATAAAVVVKDVIDRVTTLRGRLGAFQRTTLDSNSISLNDTLSNLTDAQSKIRDADFAKESANLTRAQILTQSGTRVLALANQSPQSVLSLLQ